MEASLQALAAWNQRRSKFEEMGKTNGSNLSGLNATPETTSKEVCKVVRIKSGAALFPHITAFPGRINTVENIQVSG